ncbi:MAG: EF-hand domain-containing protein [Sphingomonadaceae bacterium]|nr:EF-hand domain-containing protein [Sphingomonadaceae bacterium]
MNKMILTSAAVVALAVPAAAQVAMHHDMDGPTTRADAEAKVRAQFAKMDANHDGFVTREEVQASMEAMMAEHRTDAFDAIDANHDGSISRDEFMAHRPGAGGMHTEMRAENGARGMGGHRMMMMREGDPNAGFGMFVMADGDKDGRVSLKEALDATLARFDQADANHDGTLTPEERRGAMEAMRAEMRAAPAR